MLIQLKQKSIQLKTQKSLDSLIDVIYFHQNGMLRPLADVSERKDRLLDSSAVQTRFSPVLYLKKEQYEAKRKARNIGKVHLDPFGW